MRHICTVHLLALATVAAVLTLLPRPEGRAADELDELMPGKIHVIKPGKLVKFVAKPVSPSVFTLPGATNDPTVEGASLAVLDDSGMAGADTYALPSGGWQGLGNPAGSKGYKYKGAGTPGDPCRVVLVKEKVVKAVCKGPDVTLTPPLGGTSVIVLSIGTDTKRYCSAFGGLPIKNLANVFKAKQADAPPFCGTTTTSTTSTTLPAGSCCNGEAFLSFRVGIGAGTCGEATTFDGSPFSPIACGGLYFGGGGNSVPLPATVPDTGEYLTTITGCTGGNGVVLGPATFADTGSIENCTGTGCFFGAPLPIPNPGSTPTSTCVVNQVAVDAAGEADCGTGATDLALPLTSTIYLTGDLIPGEPGLQPCPLCLADGGSSTGFRCVGTGGVEPECTPGTSDLGPAYPTSYNCFPQSDLNIGSLPIGYALTTGSVARTAIPSGGQSRVFCGFCRDADFSDAFASPAEPCLENGTAIGSPCAQPFEACQQRNQGAFGPVGGGVRTITVVGSPAGSLLDSAPHPSTLASVFCIPPTFNATVDSAGDLPSAGAAALEGETELKMTP